MEPATISMVLKLLIVTVIAIIGYFLKQKLKRVDDMEKEINSINNKLVNHENRHSVTATQIDDLKVMIQTLSNMDKKLNDIDTSVQLIKKDVEYLTKDNMDNKNKIDELHDMKRRKDDGPSPI